MTPRQLATFLLLLTPAAALAEVYAVIVEGLGGDESYAAQFDSQAEAAERASLSVTGAASVRVFRGEAANRGAIEGYFSELAAKAGDGDTVLLYLLGHGSYDDVEYKFNLPGPDITGEDIARFLDGLPGARQVIVNTSSASGSTLEQLEKDARIVVTATRSGVERHATRFGVHFADALGSEEADVDKNRLVTVEEAFRYAERRVEDYFEREGTLATEHARLQGGQADRVTLARLGRDRPAPVDSELASLMAERDTLNAEIEELRQARAGMDAADYQSQFLQKMLELAQLEERIEARGGDVTDDD